MRVLGIESSCDETAAAVVGEDGTVLSDVVASQIAVHAPYGGVVPELASRAHLTNLVPVIEQAVATAGGFETIDAIAVTQGPGLVGALLMGMSAAKAMAFARDLPLMFVDHLVAHLFAVYLRRGDDSLSPRLPFVALLVSGGHTALYEVHGHSDVRMLGQTRDDAAGEAFDKVAKLLGLGYPGGPLVDRLAGTGDASKVTLPTPMASRRTLDFSFSGLKTAVRKVVKDGADPADVCAAFQRSVVHVLVEKSAVACERTSIPRLVLGGGVAANRGLRARAAEVCAKRGIELFVPPLASCTDNAAMIAYVGARRLANGERDDPGLTAHPRAPDLRRGPQ